jgi:hypothetical protein
LFFLAGVGVRQRITGSLANIHQEHLRPGIAGDHNAIIDKLNTLTALERVSLIEWIEAP